jgi:hypothetical protein
LSLGMILDQLITSPIECNLSDNQVPVSWRLEVGGSCEWKSSDP